MISLDRDLWYRGANIGDITYVLECGVLFRIVGGWALAMVAPE
jgi:hypothetical protein